MNVRLEVNQMARVDFALEVGEVTETVQVTGAAPLIESDTSAIGQVIETQGDRRPSAERPELRAIGDPGTGRCRRWLWRGQGTIMSGTRPDDLRPGSELFSNGNREGSNNFLMDGVDNNERLTLAIVLRPSVEAVREFKIQTNMFAADQGRNSGATVNVITKSGSNDWHGSAYEFLRNDELDARNYFAPQHLAKAAFRQNQFGGYASAARSCRTSCSSSATTKGSAAVRRPRASTPCRRSRCAAAISPRSATSSIRQPPGRTPPRAAALCAARFPNRRIPAEPV